MGSSGSGRPWAAAGSCRMYTLLSGLYKYMFQKDEYCILILGLDNAGKTTFLEQSKTRFNKQYKGMSLSKITTTVGLNIGTVDVGKARLMFWDLGGQEELQSLWDKGNPYWAQPCCLCHAGPVVVAPSTLMLHKPPGARLMKTRLRSGLLPGPDSLTPRDADLPLGAVPVT
ncbi:ADP-ribosylation factor-related protein 1 isoform X4 [Sciurus carolinensis]|uniref:ADP-ribosylation factor-related protein 1 isoform X4 n=1 Tax=Sciurus carolinensis TaxID=30640 RepID=UPI001FB22202|nr:ADP-ribosylation factor-related protein 1 isoform X4 [Sciurus carolinensis]